MNKYIGVWYLPSGNVCVGVGFGKSPERAITDIKGRYLGASDPKSQFLGITKYPMTESNIFSPNIYKARWLFRTTSSAPYRLAGPWTKPTTTATASSDYESMSRSGIIDHWSRRLRAQVRENTTLRAEIKALMEQVAKLKEQLRETKKELDEVYDQLREEEANSDILRERIREAQESLSSY